MRHHRQAARLVNQLDGIRRGHLEFRHPRGPVLLEKPLEGLVQARAKPRLDQRARDVRPARRPAVRQRKHRLGRQRHFQLIEPRHHFADAVLAHGLELGDLR